MSEAEGAPLNAGSNENKGYYKCPRCHGKFETEQELELHFKTHWKCRHLADMLILGKLVITTGRIYAE